MGCGSSTATKVADVCETSSNNKTPKPSTQISKKQSSIRARLSKAKEMAIMTNQTLDKQNSKKEIRKETETRGRSEKEILDQLQAEGLIGGRVKRGGSAFDVSLERKGGRLEPLASAAKKAPRRLKRLDAASRRRSRVEVEEKLMMANKRREEAKTQKRSRLAQRLALHIKNGREIGCGEIEIVPKEGDCGKESSVEEKNPQTVEKESPHMLQ